MDHHWEDRGQYPRRNSNASQSRVMGNNNFGSSSQQYPSAPQMQFGHHGYYTGTSRPHGGSIEHVIQMATDSHNAAMGVSFPPGAELPPMISHDRPLEPSSVQPSRMRPEELQKEELQSQCESGIGFAAIADENVRPGSDSRYVALNNLSYAYEYANILKNCEEHDFHKF